MNLWLSAAVSAISAYLLGNINGSILTSRLLCHDDVRTHGSGNAGLTNFFRNYGGFRTFLVIFLDFGKAIAACLLGGALLTPFGYRLEGVALSALFVALGHNFPVFLGFRGGKGILCSFASILILDWQIGIAIFAVFAAVYLLTNYVSAASVLAAAAGGLLIVILHWDKPIVAILGAALAALAIFMHRSNINRLLHGKEVKTYFFKRRDRQ